MDQSTRPHIQAADQNILSILEHALALAKQDPATWDAAQDMLAERAIELIEPEPRSQAELKLVTTQPEPDLHPREDELTVIAMRKGVRVSALLSTSTGEIRIPAGTRFAQRAALEDFYVETWDHLQQAGAFDRTTPLELRSAHEVVVVNHATALSLIFGRGGTMWYDLDDRPLTKERQREVPKKRTFPSNGMKAKLA